MKAKAERVVNQLLMELCQELGLIYKSFCDGWVVRVSGKRTGLDLIGFNFSLNSATASRIAEDKVATFQCLIDAGIPAVEHRLFLSPSMRGWVSENASTWAGISRAFDSFANDVVVKQTGGTGGLNVIRARSQREVEAAASKLFSRYHALAVSPFVQIADEFRVLLAPIDGEVEVIGLYSKRRESVVGDGVSTVRQLHASASRATPRERTASEHVALEPMLQETGEPLGYDDVAPARASVVLHWKHNLGQGAEPCIHFAHTVLQSSLSVVPHEMTRSVRDLALAAGRAIGLRFGAVDVLRVKSDTTAELRVLEINAGMMLDNFAMFSAEHRAAAKAIYRLALTADAS